MISTHKTPNNALAEAAGIKIGSTGGIIVDERMATSAPDVWAAGDADRDPARADPHPAAGAHRVARVCAGQDRRHQRRRWRPGLPRGVCPWGTPAGKWVIGGASFGETTATALGIPYVLGTREGISRARYYPGVQPITVKLLAEPGTLRLIGAQMIGGGEGIKERADFLAQAIRFGMTLHDLVDDGERLLTRHRRAQRADRRRGHQRPGRREEQGLIRWLTVLFAGWLRTNSEHYLLIAAHRKLAREQGAPAPRPPHGVRRSSGSRSSRPSTQPCRGRCAAASCAPCRAATARRGHHRHALKVPRSDRPSDPPPRHPV